MNIEMLERFKKRIEDGKSIRYVDIKKDDSKLLYYIEKNGGVTKWAERLGISKDDLVKNYGFKRVILPPLTDEEVISRLLYLKKIGKLTTHAMRTEFDDLRLENYLKRNHGSVKLALEYYNLEKDTRLVPYDSLVNSILKLEKDGFDLSYSNMILTNSKILYTMTSKLKKSWYECLDEIGVKYESKYILEYTRDIIISKLEKIKKEHREINYSLIKKYDPALSTYIDTRYDSILDFYVDFNMKPEEHMDFESQRLKGYLFERYFKELLEDLNIEFEYNKYIYNNKLRPDFILENNIFLDCKLSSWTSTIDSTIEKYLPHCSKLIMVVLRGNINHLQKEYTNIEFKTVYYYLDKLENNKRQYYLEKFNSILNSDNLFYP